MLDRLLGLFSNDLAIDLGTANTLVFANVKGGGQHVELGEVSLEWVKENLGLDLPYSDAITIVFTNNIAADKTMTSNSPMVIVGISIGTITRESSRARETPWIKAASVHDGDKLPTARIMATVATGKKRRPNIKATGSRLQVSQSS